MVAGCAAALIACGSASSASISSPNAPATPDAAAAVANPVAVSPQPGTPDASPSTQISFLGGSGTQVSAVSVKGSRSGSHGGVLRPYSTGTGESFIPSHPFTPGEKVTVHAQITAGPNTGPASTSFTIAHQYAPSQKQFPLNPGNAADVQHYVSAPSLTPSTVRILTHAKPGAAPGDLLLAPYQGKGTPGPMISDQNGQPDLVQTAAGRTVRHQPPGRRSRRPAGADLVAGADPRGRLRSGRIRDRQLQLPADRPRPGGERLPRRPARDPHRAGRHGLDRRVRPDPDEPRPRRTASPTAS